MLMFVGVIVLAIKRLDRFKQKCAQQVLWHKISVELVSGQHHLNRIKMSVILKIVYKSRLNLTLSLFLGLTVQHNLF